VIQPLYRSCTVHTGTPFSLKMLSNSGHFRHASGTSRFAPALPVYLSASFGVLAHQVLKKTLHLYHESILDTTTSLCTRQASHSHRPAPVQSFGYPTKQRKANRKRSNSKPGTSRAATYTSASTICSLPALVIRRPVASAPADVSANNTSLQPHWVCILPPLHRGFS